MRVGRDTLTLYQGTGTGGATTAIRPYSVSTMVTPKLLHVIQTIDYDVIDSALTVNWATNQAGGFYGTGQSMISNIQGMGKDLEFGYRGLEFTRGSHTYIRNFLAVFNDLGNTGGCGSPINYTFKYVGETDGSPHSYTTLSDSSSTQIDYWGYMNRNTTSSLVPQLYVNPSNSAYQRYAPYTSSIGSDYTNYLAGTIRYADSTSYVSAGSLNKITNAIGGWTTLVYEPNDYLDVPSNTTLKGSGIRIKQIIDSVGVGSSNNIIRNYSYLNPSTGKSSGKPVSLPVFAFTTPYTGSATGNDYWNYSTIRSATDFSDGDHTIEYGYVKESQTGAGSTQYQFYEPATNWDSSAAPACASCTTEWYPVTNYIGRTNCSSSYGPVKNDIDSYPFAPNPNYDFERGMPQKVTGYSETGVKVSETTYTYARTATPTTINALRFDYNGGSTGVLGYAKYKIYTYTGELTTQQVSKVYNSADTTGRVKQTVNYTYGSSYHKKLTQTQTTNSDGASFTSNIKYVKDYTVAAGSNANVTALYNLQLLNINAPVESYTQVTRGGTTLTTSGKLTLFSAVSSSNGTFYLPSKIYKFASSAGTGSFSPMSISGQTITSYSGYINTGNFTSYDYTGAPQTTDDGFKHQQTMFLDHFSYQPMAIFSNAANNEVAFSDFDSNMPYPSPAFTLSGTHVTVTPGHTGNGSGFTNSQTLTKTITKNALAGHYVFSAWVSSTNSGTNYLYVQVTNSSSTSHTYTLTYPSTGGPWKYYQIPVPLTDMTSTFSISVSSSQNISIDDVLFYPDNAEVATFSYDPTTRFKVAETNTNGVSAYYSLDHFGRLLFQYDQDKNIVLKKLYVSPQNVTNFAAQIGMSPSNPTTSTSITFGGSGGDPCTNGGNTYAWDFGDGTTTSASLTNTATHTYTTTGTHSAILTVVSPYFGTKKDTLSFTVSVPIVALSYTNNTLSNGNISNVYFYQGSTLMYSFTASQLNTATVLQGTYTIEVVFASGSSLYNSGTGTGYTSVLVGGYCQAFNSSHNTSFYTFSSMDLTTVTSLNFLVSQFTCDYFAQ